MWQSYLNGLFVTAGLIMALGAQNAFVLSQSLRREHHLPAAALCIVCDAILISIGVFGLATLLMQHPALLNIARWGGAAFLLWLAAQALRRAIAPQALHTQAQAPRSRRSVLLATLAVSLLNPHVYLDTVLLIGSVGTQQSMPAAYVIGAVSASLIWFLSLALAAAKVAPHLQKPSTWRVIDGLVAAMMLSVVWQLLRNSPASIA